jgi:hypothetical protein
VIAEKDAQLQDRRPNFEAEINTTITANVRGVDNTGKEFSATGVFINLTLLNKGAPSIARRFRIFLIVGQSRVNLPLFTITDGMQLSNPNLVLGSADAIYEKGVKRIERGAQISGWLYAQVDRWSADEIRGTGNVIEVVVEDYLGTEYTASQIFSGEGHDPLTYIPGSNRPGGPLNGSSPSAE